MRVVILVVVFFVVNLDYSIEEKFEFFLSFFGVELSYNVLLGKKIYERENF